MAKRKSGTKKAKEAGNGENGGIVALTKELFQAAITLRGSVEPADYKRYVLPIIFLRFLSLRYDRRRAELEAFVADKNSDYYGDKAAIHDADEYRRVGAFVIPEAARWENIRKAAQADDIKVKLDDVLESLEEQYRIIRAARVRPRQLAGASRSDRVTAMMNSEPASERIANTASGAGLQPLRRLSAVGGCAAVAIVLAACSQAPSGGVVGTTPQGIQATPVELREVVKDAYVYGFPMVDSYRIQHSYFVNATNPEFKGAWNQPHSVARVFTPQDKAIQTPNSDTPYTFLGADLRAEPLVISVPAIPKDRYYSLQFIDMYTHNFAYVGSRATGNEAGHYLLAGPAWKGAAPEGIKSVIRSETHFAFVLYRTQLFGASDLEDVKKIQAQYTVRPLSQFTGTSAPPAIAPVEFRTPLSADAQKTSPEFFTILNFLFGFAPTHPSEKALMERFARAGLGPGRAFDAASLSAEQREAVEEGMADAWRAFATFKSEQVDTGKKSSADGFGTREFLQNDYMMRMSSAVLGIYGNSKEEANYPAYFVDSERKPLDGATGRYTVRFQSGQLPPVNAFWSLTMYELPASLLTENPINRYLINSPMEPDLVRDPDGGVTLYIQHQSPNKDKEPNWLPAPKGPFFMVLREYWPKPEALDGSWKVPQAVRATK